MVALRILAAVAVVLPIARAAHAAPDREACVAAYESAQVAMRRGRLNEARENLGVCLDEACAPVLRSDCAQWLKEVESRLPAIVLSCEGPDGRARTDVRVLADGREIADHLDGRAVAIDPGEHVFRFELPGEAPLEERFVVREGDKLQPLAARFPRPLPRSAEAPTPETPGPEPRAQETRPIPWTVFALGGVGVAAATGFIAMGLAGVAGKSDLDREGCKPDCSSSDVSAVRTKFIAADVFLGISLISLGAATYLYLTRKSVPAPPAGDGLRAGGARTPFAVAF